jgi:hypothetical protein
MFEVTQMQNFHVFSSSGRENGKDMKIGELVPLTHPPYSFLHAEATSKKVNPNPVYFTPKST